MYKAIIKKLENLRNPKKAKNHDELIKWILERSNSKDEEP